MSVEVNKTIVFAVSYIFKRKKCCKYFDTYLQALDFYEKVKYGASGYKDILLQELLVKSVKDYCK